MVSDPEGWFLGGRYEADGHAEAIRDLEIREDDAWIVSYPKSGKEIESTKVPVVFFVKLFF